MKTQAIIFPEANSYKITTLTLDKMGTEDVLVRTLTTAVSPGTERWTLRGKHMGTSFPCVPGYHRIGIVEDCGSEVTELQVGDIVYGSSNRWQEKNIKSMFGAHVGYSVANASAYTFLSSKMMSDFELKTVCFTILISIAQRGIETLNMKKSNKMLMIGSGFIGLMGAQLAAMQGVETILLDVNSQIIKFVNKTFPNQKIISPLDKNWLKELKSIAPQGFEYLYDTVGHAETTNALISLMHQQGEIMLQAQYFDKQKQAIDLDMIKVKELTIKSTCGPSPDAMRKTINQILNRELKVAPLITHHFKAKDAIKAYELLDKNTEFNLGMLIDWR